MPIFQLANASAADAVVICPRAIAAAFVVDE
jgi:hypothetical protein